MDLEEALKKHTHRLVGVTFPERRIGAEGPRSYHPITPIKLKNNKFKNRVQNATAEPVNGVQNTVNGVQNATAEPVNGVQNTVNGVQNATAEPVNGVQNTVNGVQNATAEPVNGVQNTVNGVQNATAESVNGVQNTVNGVQNATAEPVNGVQNATAESVNGVQNTVNGVQNQAILIAKNSKFQSLKAFKGVQKLILDFIYSKVKKGNEKITEEIYLEQLKSFINKGNNTVKTSLKRLKQKNIIQTVIAKNGRYGWVKFKLSDVVYRELRKEKNFIEQGTKDTKIHISSSRSINNIITTSTKDLESTSESNTKEWQNELREDLPEGYQELDYMPLAEIGLTVTRIKQIIACSQFTLEQLQEAIYGFDYDLKYNDLRKKIKTSPINYFMGSMVKKKLYEPAENYRSPQELSLERYFERLKVSSKRKEELEENIKIFYYQQWIDKLDNAEQQKIIENNKTSEDLGIPKNTLAKLVLKRYFMAEEWPRYQAQVEQAQAMHSEN